MLTPAERNSLLLSLGFLLLGAGIKVWKKWHVEIGPFDPAKATASASASVPADTALTPKADSLPSVPLGLPIDDSRKSARRGAAQPVKPAKTKPACPVDLNTASEAGLADLPGVGPRTAAALAAYRKEHGPLRDIRELLNVKGIGEKKLALIAPCLILSGAGPDSLSTQARVDPDGDGKRDSE